MKNMVTLSIILMQLTALSLASSKGKWAKVNEANSESTKQLLRTTFKPDFQTVDAACSEADWRIGTSYSKLNFEVGVSAPIGRSHFAEIMCPFTTQEIYNIYLIWVANFNEAGTAVIDENSAQFFTDLNSLGEVDRHVSGLVSVELTLFEVMDRLDYLSGSYQEVLRYYSDVYNQVPKEESRLHPKD